MKAQAGVGAHLSLRVCGLRVRERKQEVRRADKERKSSSMPRFRSS
jgi:hypothetical protein